MYSDNKLSQFKHYMLQNFCCHLLIIHTIITLRDCWYSCTIHVSAPFKNSLSPNTHVCFNVCQSVSCLTYLLKIDKYRDISSSE